MTTDELQSAIAYVEKHAPIRAWLLGRRVISDIVSLSVLEMARACVISKEELARRTTPRLRRTFRNWHNRWKMTLVTQAIFLVHEWEEQRKVSDASLHL